MWRNYNFGVVVLARILFTMSNQMLGVANGWQIYSIAHTPAALGYAGLSLFLPYILMALPSGDLADRFDRRRLMITANGFQALAAALLMILTLQHSHHLLAFYLSMAITGGARALYAPSAQAIIPLVVTRQQMPRAIAIGASAMQTTIIVSPAVAGLMYAWGPGSVYALCVLLAIGMGIAYSTIRMEMHAKSDAAGLNTLGRIAAGLVYVRTHPILLGAISLDLFAVLLGGATALLPIYARDILHTGPEGLGMLRSAMAVGAVLTAFTLMALPIKRRAGVLMLITVAIFGGATIVFGLSTNYLLSLAAMAVLGASDMISINIRSTLVQIRTPDHMRGRVSALNYVFVSTSNELGEFRAGMTAAFIGTVPAVVVGGIGTVVVVGLWSWLFPTLRKADSLTVAEE
ncbi:MAG TPA: MFS transporter [Stellaceae bacterium]|nr:MFS transporter [Stellaceae bacterium]